MRRKVFYLVLIMPIEIYEKFVLAVQGDMGVQEWVDKYENKNEKKYFSALNRVFP